MMSREVKLPPAMNNSLIKNANYKLMLAPLLLLFNGYWMIDNRQIFDNETTFINKSGELMVSNHFLDNLHKVSRHTPLLVVIVAAVIICIMQ